MHASPCSSLDVNSLVPTIYVEAIPSQEADQRHPELPGHVHGQAARGGDSAHYGYPRDQALLQDLEAAPPADHHDVVREGQPALQQRPSDELVGGVVPPHVLSESEEVSLLIEERRRVQPARRLKEPLRLPELLRQRVDRLRIYLRPRRYDGAAAQL